MSSHSLKSIEKLDLKNKNLNLAIVKSSYHSNITNELEKGAVEVLKLQGINTVSIIEVPGAYELIYGCIHALKHIPNLDGIITLGCVIKGDTEHDIFINHAVAQGIANLEIQHKLPIGFGLLTTNTEQQALDRSFGHVGNKGEEVAMAVLQSILLEIGILSLNK